MQHVQVLNLKWKKSLYSTFLYTKSYRIILPLVASYVQEVIFFSIALHQSKRSSRGYLTLSTWCMLRYSMERTGCTCIIEWILWCVALLSQFIFISYFKGSFTLNSSADFMRLPTVNKKVSLFNFIVLFWRIASFCYRGLLLSGLLELT